MGQRQRERKEKKTKQKTTFEKIEINEIKNKKNPNGNKLLKGTYIAKPAVILSPIAIIALMFPGRNCVTFFAGGGVGRGGQSQPGYAIGQTAAQKLKKIKEIRNSINRSFTPIQLHQDFFLTFLRSCWSVFRMSSTKKIPLRLVLSQAHHYGYG